MRARRTPLVTYLGVHDTYRSHSAQRAYYTYQRDHAQYTWPQCLVRVSLLTILSVVSRLTLPTICSYSPGLPRHVRGRYRSRDPRHDPVGRRGTPRLR